MPLSFCTPATERHAQRVPQDLPVVHADPAPAGTGGGKACVGVPIGWTRHSRTAGLSYRRQRPRGNLTKLHEEDTMAATA